VNNQACQIEFPTIDSHSPASSAQFNRKQEAVSFNSIIKKSVISDNSAYDQKVF
jgi:hypothetical protein